MTRIFEHRGADRIPITDGPWSTTMARWRREGLPEAVDFCDYFDIDRFGGLMLDTSPRLESKVIEETDEWVVRTTGWGATTRSFKHANSTPEHLGFTVTTPDAWRKVKERMTPSDDRIPWDFLKNHYKRMREEGRWMGLTFLFGYDITHSSMVGTERLLEAMMIEPEWVVEMFNHELDMDIAMYQKVLDAGYTFDNINWPDDMGYKGHQFFSVDTYRALLKPVHQRAIEWAHARGMKAEMHSCGDIRPFIPEYIDIGLDALNPLEVKAGVDTLEVKRLYGDKLVLRGGLNALLYHQPDEIEA
jgi:uroporphyrinogen decarboxylase